MKPIERYRIEKPPLVIDAETLAGELGFPLLPEGRPVGHEGPASACVPPMGALLMALAASKPGGRMGEFGTGSGVGSAWIASGLQGGAVLVTCEIDAELIRHVKALFIGRAEIDIRHTDWETMMADEPPFDLLFMDSGVAEALVPDRWDEITELVCLGGQIIFGHEARVRIPKSPRRLLGDRPHVAGFGFDRHTYRITAGQERRMLGKVGL